MSGAGRARMLGRMRTRPVVAIVCSAALALAQGPPHRPPHNGPRPVDAGWFALTGATVVSAPGERQEATTIVVRDGVITAVGGAAPVGATVVDCAGLVIYPGLIEPFVSIDVPAVEPDRGDAHWNPMVQPQRRALDGAGLAEKDRKQLRALGFTTVAMTPTGGNLAGSSSVVLLDEPDAGSRARIVRETAYLTASFNRNRSGYPNSEMGAIAVVRQALLDGRWYERCLAAVAREPKLANAAPQTSAALQALVDHDDLALWFDTSNELQALRAIRVAGETRRRAVIVGSGMEFRRLAALAATGTTIVVPLDYPEPPALDTAAAAETVSLRQLQSWEQAPTNSKRLLDAKVAIAWTTARLEDRKTFRKRLHEAMLCGIDADTALAALTTTPAALLGIGDRTGTITAGKLANLVVVDGELFDPEAAIRDVWVGGRRHVITARKSAELDGSWQLTAWPDKPIDGGPTLTVTGEEVEFADGDRKCKVTVGARGASRLACRVADAFGKDSGTGWLRLHLDGDGNLTGVGTRPDGEVFSFGGHRGAAVDKAKAAVTDAAFVPPALDALPTPLGGYGFTTTPAPESVAIMNATLWPSDGRGIIQSGAVVLRAGKIVFAGAMADLPALPAGTLQIDANGKHVTPGVIDCHSHTGISGGVNESGEAVTAEVRIQDVIDPDDVNWYRQLAGGVTAVNQLHGSANAIGGQSSTVKLRFGCSHPDDMRVADAPDGMKWALGENPRRVNRRGGPPSTRYPSTRMGVEALIRDRLVAAEAYSRQQAAYAALTPRDRADRLAPRRDLELEAIAEIIAGRRRIHCHSYRQDEIFMLSGIAQEYGIKIGTFQHVLEGYKVADAIKRSAIGASSFSDWWAYKFEVYDAIPDNGAIMHEVGVSVSFNSDSSEHARRLNTEAAKAVKYGGVDPAEALCFVTRNPAVQLGIFERTGSLTAGKDADVALWSGNPLSYMSRCEMTWVDGRRMFSLERDGELRAGIARERARLLQQAVAAGKAKRGKRPRERDAYWRGEYLDDAYCCREHEGGRR